MTASTNGHRHSAEEPRPDPSGDSTSGATGGPTLRQREWLTEPGEALVLSLSPVRDIFRDIEFQALTGLAEDAVVLSRLCAVPLPDPGVLHGPGSPAWSGLAPGFAWHPLVWLPARVRDRRPIPGLRYPDDDSQVFESDDEYAVRAALELSASGLYDDETGTWVDVLSAIGLDHENPDDAARVKAWIDGAYDFDLDTFDLATIVHTPAEDSWSFDLVQELRGLSGLSGAGVHLAAVDLGQMVDGAMDEQASLGSIDQFCEDLTIAVSAARYAFVPLGAEEGEWWSLDIPATSAGGATALRAVASAVRDRLAAIQARTIEAHDRVQDEFAAMAALVDTSPN